MTQVRGEIPHVNQIDRRMRELRDVGWVIRTYKDNAQLMPDELLVEVIGDRIWEPGYKRPRAGVTAGTRRIIFERDEHRCQVCGIGANEEYPHLPGRTARLTIGHWIPQQRGGSDDPSNLRTECSLCNEAAKNLTATPTDPALVMARVKELPRKDKATLLVWMAQGKRSYTRTEEAWSLICQMPSAEREALHKVLGQWLA